MDKSSSSIHFTWSLGTIGATNRESMALFSKFYRTIRQVSGSQVLWKPKVGKNSLSAPVAALYRMLL